MFRPFLALFLLLTTVHNATAQPLPWLRTEGTRIVDHSSRTIILRGINLGGWLVEEIWMMPFLGEPPAGSDFPKVVDHVTLWQVLQKRFGEKGAEAVRTALRDAWITDADFARIKGLGFNCVRVPFLHFLLREPDGWKWLDGAIDRAAKNGLYVILDLHGAPGGQSKDHHTGQESSNRFFSEPENIARGEQVWQQVARRYKERPEVAGYDLLNEPMGAPDTKTLYDVQDRLYRAIRAVDKRHIVIVEDGYTGLDKMPKPADRGWVNTVLSVHSYHFESKSHQDHLDHKEKEIAEWKRLQAERNAPLYIGEFNLEPNGTPETMAAVLRMFEEAALSWSPWTYKVVMPKPEKSMWGLYRDEKGVTPIDPFHDSQAEILTKLQQVRSERLDELKALAEAYRSVQSRK